MPHRFDLRIDSGSGPISIPDVEGYIYLDAGSGPVQASGLGGQFDAGMGSGGLRLEGFRGQRLSVDSGSGPVDLLGTDTPELDVNSGSGRVTIAMTRLYPGSRYQIDGGSGDLHLTIPPQAPAYMQIDARPGQTSIETTRMVLQGEGAWVALLEALEGQAGRDGAAETRPSDGGKASE